MTASWISRGTVLIHLGRHHFAFFRGYLDGLDLRQLWKRYIEPSMAEPTGSTDTNDVRTARALVSWISEQLVVAARRTGIGSAARVLRMSPEKLAAPRGHDVPELKEFQETRDPHQMFSEQELLELFEEEYGNVASDSRRRAKRNKRLRARQLAILNQLEAQVGADPRLSDGVDGWLDPAIAKRLIAANILSLDELVKVIDGYGFRWYTKVPRVGVNAAQYIVEWLLLPETAEALGVTLSIRSIRPRNSISKSMLPALPCRSDIVPIEQFKVPHGLDGAFGTNRGQHSSLGVRNDVEAINAWLARSKPGSHTARVYRKESERFVLWSVLEAGKAISSLTVEDCIAYREFLCRLGLDTEEAWTQRFRIRQDRWIGQRGIDRFSTRWRPFEGPLSPSSQKTALVILQSMMQWLCDHGYLHYNPFKTMPRLERGPERLEGLRALTVVEWQIAKDYLASMPRDDRYFRLRLILALASSTGCKLAELSSLRRGDMVSSVRGEEQDMRFELIICGKGDVTRRVWLNRQVATEIESHFQRRGFACLAKVPAGAPLIATLETAKRAVANEVALSPSRIYKVLKTFFEEVATSVNERDTSLAARYRRMSTHWLRHTFATHGIYDDSGLETVRD